MLPFTPMRPHRDSNGIGVDLLRVHNFAFVLRGNGRWTYAILADRKEDSLLFVVDDEGSTKKLSRKFWATSIRFVNVEKKINKQRRRSTADLEHGCDPFWASSSDTFGDDVLSLFD